eukprot:2586310-Pyramimonas_sp.AAC.1
MLGVKRLVPQGIRKRQRFCYGIERIPGDRPPGMPRARSSPPLPDGRCGANLGPRRPDRLKASVRRSARNYGTRAASATAPTPFLLHDDAKRARATQPP